MKQLMILLTVWLSLSNSDQFTLTGTVYDELSNPIEGVKVSNEQNYVFTNELGEFVIEVKDRNALLVFEATGYKTRTVRVSKLEASSDIFMQAHKIKNVDEEMMPENAIAIRGAVSRSVKAHSGRASSFVQSGASMRRYDPVFHNTEEYATIHENGFKKAADDPLSTFSIDVDAASYSNMRRFIMNGELPPKDAIRIEEMINYFSYDYAQPKRGDPFSISTQVVEAPWNKDNKIVQVGLQGEKLKMEDLPASNVVFLLDVSGSMSAPNKLPLLKSSLKLLVNELRPSDKVAMVVYAGAAGVVLPSTDGSEKQKIVEALEKLEAGGSTAGGEGIELAYKIARENYVEGGNNRIVLATDGDFNIGRSSNADMERLIEEKRKEGVSLTVLGFGMGNYKDSKMEILADKGNGNHAYIDNLREAKKVLVTEFGGTMFTIAKDVRIQVEFNPATVQAYRLIGYENRLLNKEDFNDDSKDAGELGSGHAVTALYEVIPYGVENRFMKDVDPLKYQKRDQQEGFTDELLTVKFRYKEPDRDESKLLKRIVENRMDKGDENINWQMAVVGFGMLLRNSRYRENLSYAHVLQHAGESIGSDRFGYRKEFVELVELVASLDTNQ